MKPSQAILFAAVGASLIGAPISATAATAQSARAGATIEGEQLAGGMAPAWLIAALLAVVVGVVVVTDDDDEDRPVSP